MAMEKATYWLALATLALGLGSSYQRGGMRWAHDVADRSVATVKCVADRATGYLEMAQVMLGHDPASVPAVQQSLDTLQVSLDRAQVAEDIARARQELMQARMEMRGQRILLASRPHSLCPGSAVVVHVPGVHLRDFQFVGADTAVEVRGVKIPDLPQIPNVVVNGVPVMDLSNLPRVQARDSSMDGPI